MTQIRMHVAQLQFGNKRTPYPTLYLIHTNFTETKIEKAYKKGVAKLGVDVRKDACQQDDIIPGEIYDALVPAGFEDYIDYDLNSEGGVDQSEIFRDMFLFTVYKGNNSFVYSLLEVHSTVFLGAPGLFQY